MKKIWLDELKQEKKKAVSGGGSKEYVDANIQAAQQMARGLGPDAADDAEPGAGAGVRIVFNMACKHVSSLCEPGETYKNAYDANTIGAKRKGVDSAVQAAAKTIGVTLPAKKIYFGAVETSGSGIRFYGDMCLVLKVRPGFVSDSRPQVADKELLVLDRNSYDVIRAPIVAAVKNNTAAGAPLLNAQSQQLLQWMGVWDKDLLSLIALKVLHQLSLGERRWTTGQIAQTILVDEDYIEVLYPKSFVANEIEEVRLTAADVAAEADIAAKEANGEAPLPEEAEWRRQRRKARRALAQAAIPVRVVLTAGRIKAS